MFNLQNIFFLTALAGSAIVPLSALKFPTCDLDRSTITDGWFVQVKSTSSSTLLEIKERLPPGAKAKFCMTSWYKNSESFQDAVIEIGKFSNAKNARQFGERLKKEVDPNVVVNTGPPSGI